MTETEEGAHAQSLPIPTVGALDRWILLVLHIATWHTHTILKCGQVLPPTTRKKMSADEEFLLRMLKPLCCACATSGLGVMIHRSVHILCG